ncbi:hypothetical protein A9P82_12160 [Arachidicoccus ginsenosidimutans]|nr:hypothetical protein A9P82_12160 [Arachidicoccus sp. BS20]
MKKIFAVIVVLFVLKTINGQDIASMLNKYNVVWNEPGPTSQQSMPIGNGDIGLNVWTEPNGDINFYISKTDAWGEETLNRGPWMAQGGVLMKLGQVHISFQPNTFKSGDNFSQVLKLHEGEMLINEGSGKNAVHVKIWVDANNPVIHVESNSNQNVSMKVELNDWRLNAGDKILDNKNSIEWYHKNSDSADVHIRNIVFGAVAKGKNLISQNSSTLVSQTVAKYQSLSIYPLTKTVQQVDEWSSALNQLVSRLDNQNMKSAWSAHCKWWDEFWHRSWIFVSGDSSAEKITQGYVLQRFVTACAGRGAYPIKFNGSIFTVDNPDFTENKKTVPQNADFREWGGQYWFQNTRAMYWPMLMEGDFDMMMPLFKMYRNILPANQKQVENYYHHDGAYFAETSPFWGGLSYVGPEVKANYTAHYFTPVLELSMMMLDYYDYTGNEKFVRDILLPVASNGVEFFNRHFPRDSSGKLLLDPDNSIEMYWKVHNPAPDIAGLHAVLRRLIALPKNLVDDTLREKWRKFQAILPDLPVGTKENLQVLLPYTGEQTAPFHNFENPELYAVYPFRLYGITKPGLQIAINTFNVRKNKEKGCWIQEPVQAAMLGLTGVAKEYVSFNLTRKEPTLKFPSFWAKGHDYMPDEDNGGNGENGLQQMLMYADGKRIVLLPAFPKEWNAAFKLHAPYNTTVQGTIKNGKVEQLIVTPALRKKDVVIYSRN